MTIVKYNESISILRSLLRELKKTIGISKGETRDPAVSHLMRVARDNQVTEKRFCRPEHHYKYLADAYLTYLKSSRLQMELTNKYFNKGERSIESSANLVGLKLPKQLKEER